MFIRASYDMSLDTLTSALLNAAKNTRDPFAIRVKVKAAFLSSVIPVVMSYSAWRQNRPKSYMHNLCQVVSPLLLKSLYLEINFLPCVLYGPLLLKSLYF